MSHPETRTVESLEDTDALDTESDRPLAALRRDDRRHRRLLLRADRARRVSGPMRASLWMSAVAAVLVLAAVSAADSEASTAVEVKPATVLEIYTSQGCYSCPPADRLLARLGEEASAHGRMLVPLAFHVDYWNYIGWTDPFSSQNWTERQRGYARVLNQRSIYTPQLVVDGWRQCVGSDERSVRREIERASREASAARVDLQVVDDGEGGLA